MLCPCCQTRLEEELNTGIALALCPNCQGLWLKRDELEKLIGLVQEVERGREEEHRLYEPHPRDYEDDDHYYLRYAHLIPRSPRHSLEEICTHFSELYAVRGAQRKIR